jgi:hypothetical protein
MRNPILALAALGLTAAAAPAQGWAEKMFKDGMAHDFGNVPRGAQLFHRFPITNIYAVRMEITGLSSGCGCVTAVPSKRVLEPRESAYIDVSMDARRFTGPKTVGVRVTVGPEYVSSAEIKVSATSRADVVFNPNEINFGNVVRGQAPTQTIDIEYAGPLSWQVTEVVVAKEQPLEVANKELYRRPGQVGYQLRVTLKSDAAGGAFKQLIYLKTNDPASPLVPVLVEAAVQSAVTVSPDKLALGNVKAGEELTRRVVVRGNQPFHVVEVEGLVDGVSLGAELTAADAPVQTVTFKFKPTQPGEFRRDLRIKTSLGDGPVVVTLEGTAAP